MKKLTQALVSLAAILLLSGQVMAAGEKVRVGIEGAYPPFNWINEQGELEGFDYDIANALCASAQFECEFVVQDWDGMIPGLLAKKYDAIIASMGITPERQEKVAFTNKYYEAAGKFVKAKSLDLEIPDDIEEAAKVLAGVKIGTQRATPHENFVRDNFPEADLRVYATTDEVDLDLINGRIDLHIADKPFLAGAILASEEGKDFEFVGPDYFDPRWHGGGVGIAIRKEDSALVESFNAAIADIRAKGLYQEINAKYFDFDIYGAE